MLRQVTYKSDTQNMQDIGMLAHVFSLIAVAAAQIQYTPDQSVWVAMDKLVLAKLADHSPNATTWVTTWPTWNGKVTNITQMSGAQVQSTVCSSGIVRGIRAVYDAKPFKNPKYPTKAEVDDYNIRTIAHIRRMVGITASMAPVSSTRCTAALGHWTQALYSNTTWDALYPKEKSACLYNPAAPHCNFAPNATHQTLTYGGARDYTTCYKGIPAEGIAATNADIPWSLRYSRILCQFMVDAHSGPILGRQYVHANFFYPGSGTKVTARVKSEGNKFLDKRYLPNYLF